MPYQSDPANAISALHHRVTGELLHLVDGLFGDIENALFELACRVPEASRRRRCFDLMREMRYRKSSLVRGFARRMQQAHESWFRPELRQHFDADTQTRAGQMAECGRSCIRAVLRDLTERAADALGVPTDPAGLPIGPHVVGANFLVTVQPLCFDDDGIAIVQDLFSRFVLDRLGTVYGDGNLRLQEAGFLTASEQDELNRARA
jgi:hypothetical protein